MEDWKKGITKVIDNYVISDDFKNLCNKYGKQEAVRMVYANYSRRTVDFPERRDFAMSLLQQKTGITL